MIISHKHNTTPGITETGGKGHNLLLLKQAGLHVPDFIIIPVSFFESGQEIETILPAIQEAFEDDTQFAVRSSAVAEDGSNYSFAGQFKTILNIPAQGLGDAIKDVRDSANDIAASYLQHAETTEIKMAVVVQVMVDADSAGVAFGINPVTGNHYEAVINAVYGLGEELVSGALNADTYTISENNIQKQTIVDTAVLDDAQIKTVVQTLQQLQDLYHQPQDIEFAFKDSVFFLLQSRPVTATQQQGEKIAWDNSNIIESYPGLTLPLTFSFIEKMYAAVYRQLSLVLGIRKWKVERYADVYDNMLGLLNGRVYYNLNSWYAALSLLPGYKLNATFMEQMMGVKERADVQLVTEADIKGKGISAYTELLSAVSSIIKNLRTVKQQRDQFIQDFDAVYARYAHKDYTHQSAQEIFNDYLAFEQMMVTKWKAPLVNDFFAMIYFGTLQKLCAKHLPGQRDVHNQLVASSKDIITTEPIIRLPKLAAVLMQQPELADTLANKSANEVWELLNSGRFAHERNAVQEYLDDWGERCVAELKLETITYTQAPEKLIAVLQHYIQQGHKEAYSPAEHRNDAEAIIAQALKGKWLKKKIFNHVLNKARYLVSNRENLRYYRTKGFGIVRKMMTAIGVQLAQDGLLEHPRDVFYLKLDEVADIAKNKKDARPIIKSRKDDYALYEQLPLPERVITYGKPGAIVTAPAQQKTELTQLTELQGIPCCSGVVRATVCKVASADGRYPNGEILATYATDPGYVVMFPGAKGILTERGSLLSHAAIVSREMNIPCIVGIDGLMEQLQDGDELLMDGGTGIVKILNRSKS